MCGEKWGALGDQTGFSECVSLAILLQALIPLMGTGLGDCTQSAQ